MGLFGSRKKSEHGSAPPGASAEITALIETGQVAEAVRRLRADQTLSMADLARVLGRLGEASGAEILIEAAQGMQANPDDPRALYQLGYACVDVGLDEVAIRPLRAGLRQGPNLGIVRELALALQTSDRDAEAVEVLRAHDHLLQPWPDRYLVAHSQLLSGDIPGARATEAQLPPAGNDFEHAHKGLRRRLARAESASRRSPMHHQDLRGWQYALTGTVLTSLSPHGFESMTGRWAYVGDSYERCALGIHRLRLALEAADRHPTRVCVLPDHNSLILGLAISRMLQLPTAQFDTSADALVVAYDLKEVDTDILQALVERQPGQVLFEHASNWVDPAPISPDIATLVHQVVIPPWGEQLRVVGRETIQESADESPVEEIAARIAGNAPVADVGDPGTPPDTDEVLSDFVANVRDTWLQGPRHRLLGRGPVRSSRFG